MQGPASTTLSRSFIYSLRVSWSGLGSCPSPSPRTILTAMASAARSLRRSSRTVRPRRAHAGAVRSIEAIAGALSRSMQQ